MGRRVPHQAVGTALEVLDLRREQATIRRKPRQEHHPRPRRIGHIAYPVDDLSPPRIETLPSACSRSPFAAERHPVSHIAGRRSVRAAPAKMLGHKGHLPLRSTDATDQTVSVARVRQQREAPMRTKKATAPKDGRTEVRAMRADDLELAELVGRGEARSGHFSKSSPLWM